MVFLRSGLCVGDDAKPPTFHVRHEPTYLEGARVLNFWMRLLPYKEVGGFRKEKPMYAAFPAHVPQFVGDGESYEEAGNDACLKLRYYIEQEIADGEDPMRWDARDAANLRSYGKLTAEKDAEEKHDDDVSTVEFLGIAKDYDILAYVIEGKVVVMEWLDDGVFHVWRTQ